MEGDSRFYLIFLVLIGLLGVINFFFIVKTFQKLDHLFTASLGGALNTRQFIPVPATIDSTCNLFGQCVVGGNGTLACTKNADCPGHCNTQTQKCVLDGTGNLNLPCGQDTDCFVGPIVPDKFGHCIKGAGDVFVCLDGGNGPVCDLSRGNADCQ